MKYMISVDWFQVYCSNTGKIDPQKGCLYQSANIDPRGNRLIYEVREAREFNPIYKYSYSIFVHGWCYAHVSMVPRMQQLAADSVAVKVHNRLLYMSSWAWYLTDICETFGWRIKNITRLDLALDFQKFDDGRLPVDFIRYYFTPAVDGTASFIRKGGKNNFAAMGDKQVQKEMREGKNYVTGCAPDFDYLRFGTRKSSFSSYLYNKSRELEEQHDKKYIRKAWDAAGIIEDDNLPVYRLEFSVNSDGLCVQDAKGEVLVEWMALPEFRKVSVDDFATQELIENVFWSFQEKRWNFYEFTLHGSIYWHKKMNLFGEHQPPRLKPRVVNRSWNSGTSERNAARCLYRLAEEIPDLDPRMELALLKAREVLDLLADYKGRAHGYDNHFLDLLLSTEHPDPTWSMFWHDVPDDAKLGVDEWPYRQLQANAKISGAQVDTFRRIAERHFLNTQSLVTRAMMDSPDFNRELDYTEARDEMLKEDYPLLAKIQQTQD